MRLRPAGVAAVASVALLVAAGLPARVAAGDTEPCTIHGTARDDELTGTPGDDVICGFGGDDVISGEWGNDLIGGRGEDELRGGPGDDTLRGEGGRDVVSFVFAEVGITASLRAGTATGVGEDRVEGVEGLVGSPHDDRLEGSPLPNSIDGLDGDDHIVALGGADRLRGGDGDDLVRGDSGPDLLLGGNGDDRLLGGTGTDGCLLDVGGGSKFGCEVSAYARAEGLVLFVPSRDPVGFGYHESLFESAFALRPLGHLERDANPSKFSPPQPTDGPGYVVMDTRIRPTPATSSTDVVLPSRSRGEGQHVTALVSVLGVTQANDTNDAQENRYFPDRYPHVHIEVERRGASPTPGCSL